MEEKVIAEARNITKRFPGVLALDGVSLRIVAGKVNALVGENGAGKSTLMNILSGVYTDYEGDVMVDGVKQSFRSVTEAQEKGVVIIHQELCNVPYLTVAENMFLGREPLNRLGLIDYKRMHSEAQKWLKRLNADIDTHCQMGQLRVGQQQLVEIAKALMLNARALIMDEPTSSLTDTETETLFSIIEELKSKGAGIVYISHKMNEVWHLADFVTIMRDGKLVAEKQMQDTTTDEVISMMARKQPTAADDSQESQPQNLRTSKPHQSALSVSHLTMMSKEQRGRKILDDVSFELKKGEVLGFYGLMGAGRTELLEAIFGLHPKNTKGSITVNGKKANIKHPQDAISMGLALCPEDRKRDGLLLGMSIDRNITISSLLKCLSPIGLLDFKRESKEAENLQERLSIKAASLKQLAGQLSGGNQQKIVLAKWIMTEPDILMLDEPTRGIDINAKHEIYRLIRVLADSGMSVIVVSSELPEITAISDRIITLRQGQVGQTFHKGEYSEDSILKASLPE